MEPIQFEFNPIQSNPIQFNWIGARVRVRMRMGTSSFQRCACFFVRPKDEFCARCRQGGAVGSDFGGKAVGQGTVEKSSVGLGSRSSVTVRSLSRGGRGEREMPRTSTGAAWPSGVGAAGGGGEMDAQSMCVGVSVGGSGLSPASPSVRRPVAGWLCMHTARSLHTEIPRPSPTDM